MATGDTTLKWATDEDLTITLASLASDANLLAGRESTAVVMSGLSFVEDVLLSGQVTTGTSPTDAKKIEVLAAGQIDDTPTYPDVLDGTDSNETITNADIKYNGLALAASIDTDSTSDQAYPFGPISVASLFGGTLPERAVVFIVHDTGVNLNSTAGNHFVRMVPIYRNSVLS